jgi:hypothetical protein
MFQSRLAVAGEISLQARRRRVIVLVDVVLTSPLVAGMA